VWRVVRLARAGAYDGLTFHRIVPNFIVQGGSPDANEFVGDGPFMRDEFSARSETRGTVGISSRGHDTGDAQFYINLVDNARLDHLYTIFGDITEGMDRADAILEGDTIVRVEVINR
jgi:cyclophilin family peptidyl-prolyl cis-trans isomerase